MAMRLKFICCEVFFRMAYLAAATSKNTLDLTFTPLKAHVEPDGLREIIQGLIDEAECADDPYDAIVLGFGLCGNSTAGLRANKLRLVIPRCHDCCSIFLGCNQSFIKHFGHRPSAGFGAHGFLEQEKDVLKDTEYARRLGLDKTFSQMREEYGEENARMMWQTLHPPEHDEHQIYIRVEPFESLGFFDKYIKRLHEDSLDGIEEKFYRPEDVEILEGSMRLITKLTEGDWDDEFLVIQPGQTIVPTYDLSTVYTTADTPQA